MKNETSLPTPLRDDEVAVLDNVDFEHQLILHNDDVNTFDYVIDCLVEICKHTWGQAEQCAMLVHYKGKCSVKSGSMEVLKPMHLQLLDRGLSSEIV